MSSSSSSLATALLALSRLRERHLSDVAGRSIKKLLLQRHPIAQSAFDCFAVNGAVDELIETLELLLLELDMQTDKKEERVEKQPPQRDDPESDREEEEEEAAVSVKFKQNDVFKSFSFCRSEMMAAPSAFDDGGW